jgi:hypothetical protein
VSWGHVGIYTYTYTHKLTKELVDSKAQRAHALPTKNPP